tara:strand:+ start:1778 stop:2089 length:312 start_codon:yes stop_codon:yes gene_type:complete
MVQSSLAFRSAITQLSSKQMVRYAGLEVSALTWVTGRQMETWAHGQEVLGVTRPAADRIRNVCHHGVSTFSWTFINRKSSWTAVKFFQHLVVRVYWLLDFALE